MITHTKSHNSSYRKKWTQKETQQLKQTYQQQIKKGKKQLWKRVSDKINSGSRNSRRQAIQYKWKNYCRQDTENKKRICKENILVEVILEEVPFKGYRQLSTAEPFLGKSQSDIKNTFYSVIRSLVRFIQKYMASGFSKQQLNNMLSNRNFLKIDKKISLNIIRLRRNMHLLKAMTKKKLQDHQALELKKIKESAMITLNEVGQYYYQYVKCDHFQGKRMKAERSSWLKSTGAQYAYEISSLQINGDFQSREPFIQNHFDEQISIFSPIIMEKDSEQTKSPFAFPSFPSMFNDF